MSGTIQFRRGTAALAISDNPTLEQGEPGFETNTNKLKIGDGVTDWNHLPYFGEYAGNFGNLTSTDGLITIVGGTGCVLGTGTTLTIQIANGIVTGVLTPTDYNTFMNKYSGLPSMTGKTGKFLYTNGVVESWQDAPVDASASLNKAFVVGMATALGGR